MMPSFETCRPRALAGCEDLLVNESNTIVNVIQKEKGYSVGCNLTLSSCLILDNLGQALI